MKKIELTPEQKGYLELSCVCKSVKYMAEETGLSEYKVRQYLRQFQIKQIQQACKGELK